jgi:hypothetical protein
MARRFGRKEIALGVTLAAAAAGATNELRQEKSPEPEPTEETAEKGENAFARGITEGQVDKAKELVASLEKNGDYTQEEAQAVSGIMEDLVKNRVDFSYSLAVSLGKVASGEQTAVIASTSEGDGVKVAMNGEEMTATFINADADTGTPYDTAMEGTLNNAEVEKLLTDLQEMGVLGDSLVEAQQKIPTLTVGHEVRLRVTNPTQKREKGDYIQVLRTEDGVDTKYVNNLK